MALANFFDKSALAAAQLLQGFDRAAFATRLLAAPVELAFDRAAACSPEGRATLDLAVRLLSRLYPYLVLTALDEAAMAYHPELMALALAINPALELPASNGVVALCVGDTPLPREYPVFYVGSAGWTVRFSPRTPVGSGQSTNAFAAGAAACFGAANVFRFVFADQLPHAQPDAAFRLSLLDLQPVFTPTAPEPAATIAADVAADFGEAVLVGLGAIGQGLLWVLARTPTLSGQLHLVDHETVSLSNLQRYVLATQELVGQPKAEVAAAALRSTAITPVAHPGQDWAAFLAQRADWQLPLVLAAVDSAADRVAIQAALPRRVLNAWTQADDLGVSRHDDFLNRPCLACLYPARPTSDSFSKLVADSFGLPGLEFDIRAMLHNNAVVEAPLLAQIAAARGRPVEDLHPFAGLPIRAFYQEVVCGGLLVSTAPNHQTETPMAFQSALAGILLGVEFVFASALGRAASLPTTTRLNLLRPLAEYLNQGAAKNSRCLCQDQDFRLQYSRKYRSPSEMRQLDGAHR